jgi:hypothetical protein
MRERHAEQERQEDVRLQDRAREREEARQVVQQQIADWKKMRQQRETGSDAREAAGSSRLSRDWQREDSSGADQSEDRAEQRKEQARRKHNRQRGRGRRRNRDRDRGHER